MRRRRNLEQTPGLIDSDVADDVGSMHAGVSVARGAGRIEACRQVIYRGAVEHGRIIEADGAGHAVAELGGVLDVVYAGDGVMTTEQIRVAVARVTMPRRRIGRGRLTESEAGELDEHELDPDIATACAIKQVAVVAEIGSQGVRVLTATAEHIEREVALTEGANHAIFSGGARINRQRHTRMGDEIVAITVLRPRVTAPGRGTLGAAGVERGVGAQITTQLDAGVGARNIEETGAIHGADPHVLARFALDGKISSPSPTPGDQPRR